MRIRISPVRLGLQVANVMPSPCEAKFGLRVWETKFGRVRRINREEIRRNTQAKTPQAKPYRTCEPRRVNVSKIDTYGVVCNRTDLIRG